MIRYPEQILIRLEKGCNEVLKRDADRFGLTVSISSCLSSHHLKKRKKEKKNPPPKRNFIKNLTCSNSLTLVTKVSRTEPSYIYFNELNAFIYITEILNKCLSY